MNAETQLGYIEQFVETYFSFSQGERERREAECLRLQFSRCILPPEGQELLCGKCDAPGVGFGMQESGMGYFLNESIFRQLDEQLPEKAERLQALREKWLPETGRQQLL